MTLLAAFQTLLSRYSGQDDIVVGTPIANRTRAEVEGLIGFFVNTLALRTDLSGDPSFGSCWGGCGRWRWGRMRTRTCPSRSWWRSLQPERSLSHSPLFQVMFMLQNAPGAAVWSWRGLSIEGWVRRAVTAKFDLSLIALGERGAGLGWRWSTTPICSTRIAMRALAGALQTLLEGIVADPAAAASRVCRC